MASGDKKNSKLEEQIQRIVARLDAMERRIEGSDGCHDYEDTGDGVECCGLPRVPTRELETGIDPGRESLIRSIEKKWVNGTELKYYFYSDGVWGGAADQQQVVKNAFHMWKEVGIGLSFKEVQSPDESDIRIGFLRRDGSWSYVGRDIWRQPDTDRTMNFGWHLSGQNGLDTALHEIGHTLGFHHEQQNPFAAIEWNEDAVYRYFTGPPNNWSRQKTFHNVLRTLDPNSVDGSNWDPDSIMQYSIRAGLIERPEQYRDGLNPELGLSDTDKDRVRVFYPPIDPRLPELKRYQAEQLNIEPARQVNFVIKPRRSRRYQIQTFGQSDTVMVLFEDNDGTLEHVAADDDSGWDRNASINVRLVRNREYVLRVRLYFSHARGETAVMYW